MIQRKFVKVTEHYGYYRVDYSYYSGFHLYFICRIVDGKRDNIVITHRSKWQDARKECKYLEKLNEKKFKEERK